MLLLTNSSLLSCHVMPHSHDINPGPTANELLVWGSWVCGLVVVCPHEGKEQQHNMNREKGGWVSMIPVFAMYFGMKLRTIMSTCEMYLQKPSSVDKYHTLGAAGVNAFRNIGRFVGECG